MSWLVAIVGPTAVGKSLMALELAQALEGEIVNADSRQVYRYMDIGTAKPGPEQRALVSHHLVDIIAPDEDFSLALYHKQAYNAIDDIQARKKLPFLVGGSGLYIWSVIEGWQIPPVPPDPDLRRELETRLAREGIDSLYSELKRLDPLTALRIDPRNVRRLIRALEVCLRSGNTFSRLQQKQPRFPALIVGLTTERQDLYHRIDSRVDDMIAGGLVEETRELVGRGYGFHLPSMSGIGYRQIGMYLRGEMGLEAAIQQIKFESHRFARHQYAWFKPRDERIHWFDVSRTTPRDVGDFISSKVGSP